MGSHAVILQKNQTDSSLSGVISDGASCLNLFIENVRNLRLRRTGQPTTIGRG